MQCDIASAEGVQYDMAASITGDEDMIATKAKLRTQQGTPSFLQGTCSTSTKWTRFSFLHNLGQRIPRLLHHLQVFLCTDLYMCPSVPFTIPSQTLTAVETLLRLLNGFKKCFLVTWKQRGSGVGITYITWNLFMNENVLQHVEQNTMETLSCCTVLSPPQRYKTL